MKKVIKPSPINLLIFGIVAVVVAIIICIDTATGGTPADEEYLLCVGSVICFVFFLVKYILRGKVYFDDDTFTVHGKTYKFSQISDAVIRNKRTNFAINVLFSILFKLRRFHHFGSYTKKIEIYVKNEYVMSFTEDEPGANEFIALLKRHRKKFTVHNSLSSWKGVIE